MGEKPPVTSFFVDPLPFLFYRRLPRRIPRRFKYCRRLPRRLKSPGVDFLPS